MTSFKNRKSSQKRFIKFIWILFSFLKHKKLIMNVPNLSVTFLVTFPFFNDVIRNLVHDNIGFVNKVECRQRSDEFLYQNTKKTIFSSFLFMLPFFNFLFFNFFYNFKELLMDVVILLFCWTVFNCFLNWPTFTL